MFVRSEVSSHEVLEPGRLERAEILSRGRCAAGTPEPAFSRRCSFRPSSSLSSRTYFLYVARFCSLAIRLQRIAIRSRSLGVIGPPPRSVDPRMPDLFPEGTDFT